jgi:hypothetical protein
LAYSQSFSKLKLFRSLKPEEFKAKNIFLCGTAAIAVGMKVVWVSKLNAATNTVLAINSAVKQIIVIKKPFPKGLFLSDMVRQILSIHADDGFVCTNQNYAELPQPQKL